MNISNMKLALILVATACAFSSSVYATQDTGTITTFYATAGGMFAIKLDGGFTNAINAFPANSGACGAVSANGYAGASTADPVLKSILITAKAAQQKVTIGIQGCDTPNNPHWFKITDVYVDM